MRGTGARGASRACGRRASCQASQHTGGAERQRPTAPARAGRQGEELEPARSKAEAAGVKEIFIEDLREEFVRDYVFPMFRCAAAAAVCVSGSAAEAA